MNRQKSMKLSERLACKAGLELGDNHSQLLDHFERVSFEAHLNQVILLGRSLSEPGSSQVHRALPPPPHAVAHSRRNCRTGRSASGIRRVLKKLLRPVLGRKSSNSQGRDDSISSKAGAELCVPMPTKCSYSKVFSRSLRI